MHFDPTVKTMSGWDETLRNILCMFVIILMIHARNSYYCALFRQNSFPDTGNVGRN